MKKIILSVFTLSILVTFNVKAGDPPNANQTLGQDYSKELNAITTSVPFLMIAPDSRSGAMGDAGVALSPDVYSQHWNSSKLAFIESPMGATMSYTPWLKKLVDDINLAYLAGYYQIDKNQTIGASLRYFTMGNITFTDESNEKIGDFSPHEFALDASYNRKLSENFALGVVGRFIYSNLTGGTAAGEKTVSAGKTVAIDVNGYYTNKMTVGGYDGNWAAGFNISNVGAKLGYTEDEKNFIPTNLRIGGAGTLHLDDYNSITATFDVNKLLVPTPPVYYIRDEIKPDGTVVTVSGEEIKEGKDNDVAIVQGMVQSFYDAPGGGKEELHEISYAVGLEYWYAKQFAVRAGYFYEHATKGNRKYFTAGVGLKMNVFGLDFSYLVPAGNFNNSPLSNTWRFSLIFDLESFTNQ
ncbi:MAG: type IX secretion system outer membrane channel protein PorV [Salinivirgaceae bacterium]|nr:type IX secretion system outer membrane channel protein PorV [Salinivirgaceae bacterium]